MAVLDNLNKATSPGVQPSQKEQYYVRQLLKNMKPELVHGRDAQKVPLPAHNGTRAQFRRWTPFPAMTKPLSEGVTPKGQDLRMTAFTTTIKPYGAHVELTDEINWQLTDSADEGVAVLLSDQATLSLDTLARDSMNAGMNVQFTKDATTSRAQVTAADKLTYQDIKRAVRTLKRNNCKPFSDGFYHAIVHPDTVFDLTSDPMWVDVAKYQEKEKTEKYELGKIYKVRFFESTNAKMFTPEAVLYGEAANLAVTDGSWNAEARTLKTGVTLTHDDCRALAGKMVNIKGGSALTPMCIEYVNPDGTVKLRWDPGATVTAAWATGVTVEPSGGGAEGVPVFSTLVYGLDSFGEVALDGSGKNVEVIVNPPGSSGAMDPLKQRGTVAWKVKGFCSVILQDDHIVRIEHGATA